MKEIYVKEMPKNCLNCPCSDEDYERGVHCNFGLEQDLYTEVGKTLAHNGKQRPLFLYETLPKDCPLKSLHEHDKELVAKQINTIDGIFNHFNNKLKGTKFDERMVFIELQALHQKIITTLQKEIQHDKN